MSSTSFLNTSRLQFTTDGTIVAAQIDATADTLTLSGDAGGDVVVSGVDTPVAGTDAANKDYVDSSSGGSPGGADTSLQYNNAGTFGGISNWTTNGTDNLSGGDSAVLSLGTSDDLTLTSDGANPTITNQTGDLIVSNTNATGSILARLGSTDANTAFTVQDSASASVCTITAEGNATIAGDVTANNFNAVSDASLKTNIVELDDSLDLLCRIRGVQYEWAHDSSKRKEVGVLAQELEAAGLGCLVNTTTKHDKPIKSVNYLGLIPLLIESIKELRQELLKRHNE